MATKIIKESQLRRIFKDKQISERAIEFFDDYVQNMLSKAYESIKDNDRVKRVSKGIAEFIISPNALILDDGLGGDEDWIAFVPEYFKGSYIGFLDAGTPFGCCCVEEHEVADGTIFIGCHA